MIYIIKNQSTMKYSQYVELKEILDESHIDMKDVKEAPEALNESFLMWLGLAGLAVLFRKRLWRWGVKKVYMQYLMFHNKRFQKSVVEKANDFAIKNKKYIDAIDELIAEYKDIPGDVSKKQIDLLEQRKVKHENSIVKTVNDFISRAHDQKKREIYQVIDETNLPESHKMSLKYFWDVLGAETRAEVSNQLVKAELIQNEQILRELKDQAEEFKKEAMSKLDDLEDMFDKKATDTIDDEEDKGDKEDLTTKITPMRFRNMIENLSQRREDMDESKFENVLSKYVELAFSVKDKETRDSLVKKLKTEFDEDVINDIIQELDLEEKYEDILKDDKDLQ